MKKNLLITGNLGYIGTVLTGELKDNFNIIGLDSGLFEDDVFEQKFKEPDKQIKKDIRDISVDDLENIDSVVHLAALSNDPLGELDQNLTYEINFLAAKKLIDLAIKTKIKRFIYISSQSMYGISNEEIELDEDKSEKNPVTEYAKTNWDAEVELNKLSDKNFSVTSLRPSTVYGVSPRLRCDIVFNNLLACAYTTGKIEIKSDGSPWRPVVHVRDVCSAILAVLGAPIELVEGKAFNIGIKDGNYTVKQIAEVVNNAVKGSVLKFTNEHLNDPRTYKVSFNRILTELKDYYKPVWSLEKGAVELLDFFKKINFNENQFRGFLTNRLQSLSKSIKDNKIDNNFRIKI